MSDDLELTDPIPVEGPLTAAQSMALCRGCVRCCTYVSVEVDPPNVPWMYDQYVWLLEHRGVWMYVETGNHWYVQFETVCEQLDERGGCRIHGRHPVLCKEYDARSCERRGEVKILARFRRGDDLVRWMEARRPVHHRRWRAWFEKAHAGGDAAAGAGTNGGKPPKLERYEMPPAPTSPLGPPPGPFGPGGPAGALSALTLRKVRPRAAAPRRS
jgi:hypothetical protein